MNGYQKRTQQKKASIMEAARELFTERGISDVKISEIAAKAKVSQVSIYNYFDDKSTLASEVLIGVLEQVIQEYEDILRKDISFQDKLHIIMMKKQKAVEQFSRSHFSEEAWADPVLRQVYSDAATKKSQHIYKQFIALGKQEGAIDNSIPDEALLTYLTSSIQIMQQPDYMNTSNLYKLSIFNLFLYGLVGRPSEVKNL